MREIEEIGNRIRLIRKALNITSVELAQAIQISQPYLSRIERGLQPVPLDVLINICNKFDITLEQFFSEDENFPEMESLYRILSVAKKLSYDELEALYKFLELTTSRNANNSGNKE